MALPVFKTCSARRERSSGIGWLAKMRLFRRSRRRQIVPWRLEVDGAWMVGYARSIERAPFASRRQSKSAPRGAVNFTPCWMPMPLSGTVGKGADPLTASVLVRVALAVGLKVTEIVQLLPAPRLLL